MSLAVALSDDRLASHGELLAAWLARPHRSPARWRTPGFARVVDLVRTHLRPIIARDLLAWSYTREHFHGDPDGPSMARSSVLRRDATEVAYALRWLELGDERPRPAWLELVSAVQE